MTTKYLVGWTIDIEAESPVDAAKQALAIQRNPNSIATVFTVHREGADGVTTVDLTEGTVNGGEH